MPVLDHAKEVKGVEIFASGTWTDSQGQEREWTDSDLNKLISNFKDDSGEHPIPVKVGHTDDDFNNQVADELGIPNSLLTGDEGMGAARLGQISKVYKDGEKLKADFDNVPDQITRMIEAGMFNAVSVEIDMPSEDDPHLSGVAILGAEAPAVPTLAALDMASVFSAMKGNKWVTLRFQDGEPEQIDPEALAIEFAEISDKMEEVIRGKRGARILRAFWSEVKRKMSDMTGKKFSSQNWAAIIEAQRNSTLTLPLEVVAKLCPDCGAEMGARGLSKLKVKNYEMPEQLKKALMALGGEADDNYFARLMALDIGVEGGDKMALCAQLTKEYTGKYPTLSDGGEHSEAEETVEHQESETSEFQPPPQLASWAAGVSFDECVRQLSDPSKGISDPDALCASLKRAAGEMQMKQFHTPEERLRSVRWIAQDLGLSENASVDDVITRMQEIRSQIQTGQEDQFKNTEEDMNEFVLAPEDLPRLYEALGLDETATIEDVLAAIMALKGEEAPMPEGGEEMPPMEMPMSEEKDSKIAELEAQIAELRGFNANLKHERLVMTYSKMASGWKGVGIDPEQFGNKMAGIHEKAGEEAVQEIVSHYQTMSDEAEKLGVTKSLGAANRIDEAPKPDEFEDEVKAYAESKGVSFQKALAEMAIQPQYQVKFAAYRERQLV